MLWILTWKKKKRKKNNLSINCIIIIITNYKLPSNMVPKLHNIQLGTMLFTEYPIHTMDNFDIIEGRRPTLRWVTVIKLKWIITTFIIC